MYLKLPIFYFWIVLIFSVQNAFGQDCTVPFSTTYYQPFSELNDDDLPACWSEANSGIPDETGPIDIGVGAWREDGFANNGSTGAMRIRLNSASDQDWLISPIINIATVGIQVEFDIAITASSSTTAATLGSDDELQFLLSSDAGVTWVPLQTWTQADNVDAAGENKVYDLTAYSGMDLIFAFWGYEGIVDDEESSEVFIDNFYVRTPPTCLVPISPSVNGIGSVSANFDWTPSLGAETTWDVELVDEGSDDTGIPTVGFDDVTTTSITLQDLLPETSYSLYLRSDCGMDNASDVSSWAGPFSFTTGCASFTTPYQEDFFVTDGPSGGTALCWSEANDGNLADGPSNFGGGSWAVNDQFANVGDESMRINLYQSGDVDWLITPNFILASDEQNQVEFDLAATDFLTTNQTNFGSDDRFVFLISNDNGANWVTLQDWTAGDVIDPAGVKIIHDLSAFTGTEVKFAFWASEGEVDDPEDYEIFIDNFFVRKIPTCLEITDLAVSKIEPFSANVAWAGGAPASVWDIEFVVAGTASTGIPTVGYDDVSNPTVITGLVPDTEYDLYVRSDCGMDNITDVSYWTSPTTFRTPCDIDAPYSQFFDVFPTDCWSTLTGGDITTGPQNDNSSNWTDSVEPGILDSAIPGFFDVNDWLISPPINLNGGAYQVEFDLSILDPTNGAIGTLGSDDQILFLVSTDYMDSWIVLDEWTASSVLDDVVLEVTHDLTQYSTLSPVFALWTTAGLIEDAEQVQLFFDNFEVTLLPIVPMVASTIETNVSCNGLADGTIDLNVTGGQTPLSYLWSNGATDEDISDLGAGVYTVTVTSSDASVIEATVTITEPTALEQLTVVLDETADGAADGSIDLTVSGGTPGYTFSWDNGATTEDLTGLDDGTYCVTITDANNCTQTTCASIIAGASSIQNISNLTSFRVYPNPVGNQKIIIDLEFSLAKDLDIQLINVFGQEVYQTNHLNVSELKTEVDAATLPSGIYFIKVTDLEVNQTMVHRLIKQ